MEYKGSSFFFPQLFRAGSIVVKSPDRILIHKNVLQKKKNMGIMNNKAKQGRGLSPGKPDCC